MRFFKIILILGPLFSQNPALAEAIDSEVKLLVWDIGVTPSRPDAGDIIFDVSKPCNSGELNLNFPVLKPLSTDRLSQLSRFRPTYSKEIVDHLFSKFPVEDDTKRMVEVIDSYKGNEDTIFVLLPEAHNNLPEQICNQQCQENHGIINATRTYFSVALAKSALDRGVAISNFREGVKGEQWKVDGLDLADKTPLERFQMLFQAGYHTPFTSLGNTFDGQNINTTYIENPLMIYAEIISVYGEYKTGMGFDQVVANVRGSFDPNIREEDLRESYTYLKEKSDAEIDRFAGGVCQVRSQEMANESLDLMNTAKTKLVFLSFGASHFHGISNVLREHEISYVAVIGKSKVD